MSDGYKVSTGKGADDFTVTNQWYKRPDDERFVSLDTLATAVRSRQFHSRERRVVPSTLHFEAQGDRELFLALPSLKNKEDILLTPSHYAFGQMCNTLRVPGHYFRTLPAPLAAENINYALSTRSNHSDTVKLLGNVYQDQPSELRAVTGPDYGRIYDIELVEAIQRLVANDPRWKVPGTVDWQSMVHNPNTEVNKSNTTLYASRHDVFVFMCQDADPVSAGKLPNGDEDWYFPGFYAWNSEVGAGTIGLAMFWLRFICQNRSLRGVQDKTVIRIKHSKRARLRMDEELLPVLQSISAAQPHKAFKTSLLTAKSQVIAKDDDEAQEWLRKKGFTKRMADQITVKCLIEEEHPLRTVYDAVQGITAIARDIPYQDDRIALEASAGLLLEHGAY